MFTFTQKKNPSKFLVKQQVKGNEKRAKVTSNEQKVTSNEQKVTNNEQKVKRVTSNLRDSALLINNELQHDNTIIT